MTVPIRVAIVDDQQMIRAGIAMILDLEPDIEVVGEASTGREALELLRTVAVDVVLMDVQMPVMDGPAATTAIRAIETAEGRRRTPILAVTANAMTHQIEEYVSAGMDGIVAKPIQLEALMQALSDITAEEGDAGSNA